MKMLALGAMTLNHVSQAFLPQALWTARLMTGLGHFTAPVMLMFLVEGYRYTHDRRRYLARLLLFAIISQVPFVMAFGKFQLNMMFTLALCLGTVWLMERQTTLLMQALTLILAVIASEIMDWNYVAPLQTVLFLLAGKNQKHLYWALAGGLASYVFLLYHFEPEVFESLLRLVTDLSGYILAGLCVPAFCQGRRYRQSRWMKWFFYGFYPAHLLVIALARSALGL